MPVEFLRPISTALMHKSVIQTRLSLIFAGLCVIVCAVQIRYLYETTVSSSVMLEVPSKSAPFQKPKLPPPPLLSVRNTTECPNTSIPSLVLAGAQKSGTSALYWLLQQHPEFGASKKFETHFFDKKLGRKQPNHYLDLQSNAICQLRRRYKKEFVHDENQARKKFTFEKSPAYLCHPRIPGYLKTIAPNAKVLLILRNPTDRVYSQWSMVHNRDFVTTITTELKKLRQWQLDDFPLVESYHPGRLHNNRTSQSQYTTLDDRSNFHRINHTRHDYTAKRRIDSMCGYVSRGMYAQQVYNWMRFFEMDRQLLVVSYNDFVQNQTRVLDQITDFVGATRYHWPFLDVDRDFSPNAKFQTAKPLLKPKPLSLKLRQYLDDFYRPYNEELGDLLGEEWRNVWTRSDKKQ